MTEKQWDDMIRINLKSVYSVIHFAVPQMIKQKSGKIIPSAPPLANAENPTHALRRIQRRHHQPHQGPRDRTRTPNILVNSVAPGWVATDMSNPVLETKSGQKMASTFIPLGRAATAEEIAGPILFVASDLANFMDRRSHQCKWRFGLVRVKFVLFAVAVLVASALFTPRACAQNPDTMMPSRTLPRANRFSMISSPL